MFILSDMCWPPPPLLAVESSVAVLLPVLFSRTPS
jgi:hypothetical protein